MKAYFKELNEKINFIRKKNRSIKKKTANYMLAMLKLISLRTTVILELKIPIFLLPIPMDRVRVSLYLLF